MLWKFNLISQDECPVCSLIPAAGPSPHRTPQLLLWRDLLIHLIPYLIVLDIVQSSLNYNQVNCVKNLCL